MQKVCFNVLSWSHINRVSASVCSAFADTMRKSVIWSNCSGYGLVLTQIFIILRLFLKFRVDSDMWNAFLFWKHFAIGIFGRDAEYCFNWSSISWFPARISGVDGNYFLGQLESSCKGFPQSVLLKNRTSLATAPFGNIGSIIFFPPTLLNFSIEVQWSDSTGVAQSAPGASVLRTEIRSSRSYYFSIVFNIFIAR